MSQAPYRAKYELADKTILQALYAHRLPRVFACSWLTAFLQQLAASTLNAFSVRLVCEHAEVSIGIYVNVDLECQAQLDAFHYSTAINARAISEFAVTSKYDFDAFHEREIDSEVLRLVNLHSLKSGTVIPTQLHLFDMLNLVFAPEFSGISGLILQFNLVRTTNSIDITRAARKLMVKLEYDESIPESAKSLINSQLQKNLSATFEIDTLVLFPDNTKVQLRSMVDDFQCQTLKPLGITNLPLQPSELADDLFQSALPLTLLEDTDIVTSVARLFDLPAQLSLLKVASVSSPNRKIAFDSELDVFISYSSKNFNQALAVCHGLESQGIRCWMAPRDIGPGESYAAAIVSAINACRAFVLVFSDASNASPHVLREVERAVNANKLIVPFKIEETKLEADLAYFISVCHWLDAVTPPLTLHIENLVLTLKKQFA